MIIKAAVLRGKSQPFTVEELELDAPRPDEILVRIAGAGICHTDFMIQADPPVLPVVLGHEGAGTVEQVGDRVTKVKPGDHVVLTFMSCGQCRNCQQGHPAYCTRSAGPTYGGRRSDGSTTLLREGQAIHGNFFGQSSFASHAIAYERNTVKIRKDAPLEIMGPLGCGVQTGAGAVLNCLRPAVDSSLAIFGLGSVGLSSVMAAAAVGCTTIAGVDINPARLQLAEQLGATHIIHAGDTDPVKTIKEITRGGADCSLENTGQPEVFRQAIRSTHRQGICGLIGGSPAGTTVTLDMGSILYGRTLFGIIEGDSVPDLFIPQLVELHMQGRLPLDRLITFYELDRINQAAADMKQGRSIKPILTTS